MCCGWKDRQWNIYKELCDRVMRTCEARLNFQAKDLLGRSIFFFGNDEHNALVVMVLLERHGLPVRWVTSDTVSCDLSEFEHGLFIYDIPAIEDSIHLNHFQVFFKQVDRLPRSVVLVGLGDAQDVPVVFADLCSRTVTFLTKPFNVSNAIRVLGLLTDNANETPI